MGSIETGLKIVLMFFVLVTIHEWGHFYFAKRAGILVREFAIGFGPKLFSYKKGETRYTLRLLPFGGYVRMAGEDPEIVQIQQGQTIAVKLTPDNRVSKIYLDQLEQRGGVVQGAVESIDLEKELYVRLEVGDEKVRYPIQPAAIMVARGAETQIAPYDRQFGSKTVGQRFLAILMGPVMNFLLAAVLFLGLVIMQGIPTNVKVDKLEPGRPSEQAGLAAGDVIKSVNQQAIGDDREKFMQLVGASANQKMSWIIERGGKDKEITITPDQTGKVGVYITGDTRTATFSETITGTYDIISTSTIGILDGFKKLVLGQFKMDDLGGPVRIVQVTGEFASHGLESYIYWVALLSLYLGLFNLLPFPALDGSRLVFLAIEGIRGKPVDPSRESMVHFIGFAMLMLLMVAVTYNDILRLIKG
ncbi:RIP metalloprotease RseP [Paenibacillus sp. FJAT-26967]|uniref:RIP metalloprotease RseP n=1 Tax=Paenibacillus sp. FJAT-26967 TaxID=1729690 RepID=UPI00083824ED|nr:RIP metalloprotease RseP [Paenibacillus sp. FJAT-26967]